MKPYKLPLIPIYNAWQCWPWGHLPVLLGLPWGWGCPCSPLWVPDVLVETSMLHPIAPALISSLINSLDHHSILGSYVLSWPLASLSIYFFFISLYFLAGEIKFPDFSLCSLRLT